MAVNLLGMRKWGYSTERFECASSVVTIYYMNLYIAKYKVSWDKMPFIAAERQKVG